MQAGTASHPSREERVLVSVPSYNERENIQRLIADIHAIAPHVHILVVDDNSPDGTGQLLDQLAAVDPRVHVIHRAGKLGMGSAIIRAMQYAMDEDFDFVINMDADYSHPPQVIPTMLAGMQHCDVMIGSRYIPGGGTENWPASRRWMSTGVNFLVRLMFRMQVKDASGGYRCYRVSKLRKARLHEFVSRGYSFQQEMLYRCYLAGCRFDETPIIFANRKFGKSKVSFKETFRSVSTILFFGLRSLFGADKPRYR